MSVNIIILEKYVRCMNPYMNPKLNLGGGLYNFFTILDEILYNKFGRCKIIFIERKEEFKPDLERHDVIVYTSLSDVVNKIGEFAAIIIPGIDEPPSLEDAQIIRTFIAHGGRVLLMYDDKSNLDRTYGDPKRLTSEVNSSILRGLGISFNSDKLETETHGQHPEKGWLKRPLLKISNEWKNLINYHELDEIFYWGCSISKSEQELEKMEYKLIPIAAGDNKLGILALTKESSRLIVCGGRFTFDNDSFCEKIVDPETGKQKIGDYGQKFRKFTEYLLEYFFDNVKNISIKPSVLELIKDKICRIYRFARKESKLLLLILLISIGLMILKLNIISLQESMKNFTIQVSYMILSALIGIFLDRCLYPKE